MDFINKMKKREFIEMGLKALASVLAAFLAIVLMEGMIYSIELNALKTKGTTYTAYADSTIAYCIKEDDDKYFVVYYNEGSEKEWSATKNTYLTEEQCKNLTVKEVVWNAPNAFEFSISGVHYVVMAVFMSAIVGFFVYKFIRLNNEYKKIEDEFNKTGSISFN